MHHLCVSANPGCEIGDVRCETKSLEPMVPINGTYEPINLSSQLIKSRQKILRSFLKIRMAVSYIFHPLNCFITGSMRENQITDK